MVDSTGNQTDTLAVIVLTPPQTFFIFRKILGQERQERQGGYPVFPVLCCNMHMNNKMIEINSMTMAQLDARIQLEIKRELLWQIDQNTDPTAIPALVKLYQKMIDQELKSRALDLKTRELALKEESMRRAAEVAQQEQDHEQKPAPPPNGGEIEPTATPLKSKSPSPELAPLEALPPAEGALGAERKTPITERR